MTNSEISVEITDQSFSDLDNWNYERFVIKKPTTKINAVEFVYVELCYKSSTSKYKKPNSNINISKIYHLPFDMLCFKLKNDNTVSNEPTINKFLEMTSGSGLHEWYDNIRIKEK